MANPPSITRSPFADKIRGLNGSTSLEPAKRRRRLPPTTCECDETALAAGGPFSNAVNGFVARSSKDIERLIMRGLAYVIAAFAALGIMYVIATFPPQSQPSANETAATTVAATPDVLTEAGKMTLAVPEMHCEFACFPKVKETLEGAQGVEEVTLAAQKEEGVLDNRQVIVKYEPGFDVHAAIDSLAAAGYEDSNVVQ